MDHRPENFKSLIHRFKQAQWPVHNIHRVSGVQVISGDENGNTMENRGRTLGFDVLCFCVSRR